MASNKFTRIQLRRGTKETLRSINPKPRSGEPIVETDTGRMKIGDGSHTWNELSYCNEIPARISNISQGVVSGYYNGDPNTVIDIAPSDSNAQIIPSGIVITTVSINYEVTSTPVDAYIIIGDKKYEYIIDDTGNKISIIDYISNAQSGSIVITLTDGQEIKTDTMIVFVIKAHDSDTLFKNEFEIKFGEYIYYGYSPEDASYGDLPNNKLISSRNGAYKIDKLDNVENNYIHFYLPDIIYNQLSSFGETQPIFTDQASGFPGGFKKMDDNLSITNSWGGESTYTHYISAHPDLGSVMIIIS